MNFTKAQINKYIQGIFAGIFTGLNPSEELFIATAEYLDEGLFEGMGISLFNMGKNDPDLNLARELRNNVHVFSAFKSHHSAVDIGRLIFDDKGGKRAFANFEKDALKYFDVAHNRHLKTEFRTSVANARAAKQWQSVVQNSDIYPFLEYQSAGDERVRDDHKEYDGIKARFDNKIWSKIYPPNGFNCRCDVVQASGFNRSFKETPKSDLNKIPDPPKLFQMNAGVDKVIFKPDHPAFTVEQKYKVKAKTAFDLPLLFGPHDGI